MPLRENGRMTSVTIPHRVPPSPRAASQTSRGACAITSRLIDVMMGMIVTAADQTAGEDRLDVLARARRAKDRNEAGVGHEPPGRRRLEIRDEQQSPEAVHDARERWRACR